MKTIKWVHLAIELHYYRDRITHFVLKFMFIFRTNNPFCSLHSKAVHIFYVGSNLSQSNPGNKYQINLLSPSSPNTESKCQVL